MPKRYNLAWQILLPFIGSILLLKNNNLQSVWYEGNETDIILYLKKSVSYTTRNNWAQQEF